MLAIEGGCGSGKSELAQRIMEHYGCPVIPMDDFFLPPALRTPERLGEPGGNIDYDRFREEVSEPLNAGRSFSYGVYDCSVMKISRQTFIPVAPLTVVEGVYSLHPKLECRYDLAIFLTLSGEEQLARIKKRSGEALLTRFSNEWIPMEGRYFEEMNVASRCDLVLNGKDIFTL